MTKPYPFRPPSGIPTLTAEGITEFISRGRTVGSRKIGSTVEVVTVPGGVRLWLYATLLATITPTEVYFPPHEFSTQATRFWLERIARDNGISYTVYKSDNTGRYITDEGAPVVGHTFPVRERASV